MNHINITRTEAEYLVKLLSRENTGMADQLIEQLVEAFGNTVKCAIECSAEGRFKHDDVVYTFASRESPFITGFGPAMHTIYRYSGYDEKVRQGLKRISKRNRDEPFQVYEWTVCQKTA